ncbi:non-ribosomal peptide synthetase [Pseudomonas sp. KNUC1026]|uniref:non-ribosomal peptide synthetase n=1 Tax=Pseudomonas sp. KNUC1026 TaxID=2893890 RepID=UPI001F4155E5|nr:non-ribosomal peptide synthetase [Pseudomonas sp. KNUC1026]UFH48683.1 non-ribosomal peptide synthetase [Pseudomonas sp. KNUC1026]
MAAALDAWSLAQRQRPLSPGDRIGLSLSKGVDLYVAILAILANGASYVPIDPALSEAAQLQLLERCQCPLVVTDQWLASWQAVDLAMPPRREPVLPTDLAYTLFTSGSTGIPKGVNVTHLNVINLVDWAIEQFEMGPGVRVLQYSTINFDASVLDIFPALLSGATLCVPDEEQRMSQAALAAFCNRHRINQAFLPPPLLNVFSPGRFPTLATVLTGGEPCHPHAIEQWADGRRLFNLYGPTEATVLVTCKAMGGATPASTIGQAIAGTRLYILDEQQRPALRGELYIAGLCVTLGYLGDPAATQQRFVTLEHLDASRLYRTGDQVVLGEDGDIQFLGRLDRQVKVRGFRIELEEIEAALLRLGCKEAAVMATEHGSLVAYVVIGEGQDSATLRDELAHHLPEYKRPQAVVPLLRMPYKANGKVDLSQLPAPAVHCPAATSPEGGGETFTALAQLWAEELRLPPGSLQAGSDFRALGGTSINIMHLLSSLEARYGVLVDFIDFLEQPTLEFLVNAVDNRKP